MPLSVNDFVEFSTLQRDEEELKHVGHFSLREVITRMRGIWLSPGPELEYANYR